MHHEDVPRAQGRPGAFINQGRQEGRGQSSAVHVRQRALGDDAHGRLAALPRANLRRHRTSQGRAAPIKKRHHSRRVGFVLVNLGDVHGRRPPRPP